MASLDTGGGVRRVVPGRAGLQPEPGRGLTPSRDLAGGVTVRVERARRADVERLAEAGWDVVTESSFDRLRAVLRGWSR